MGATGALWGDVFDLKISRNAMLCIASHIELVGYLRCLQRLLELAGIEELVEQFYNLLGAELHNAHAGAHQPLLDDRNALLELGTVLLELLVGQVRRRGGAAPGQQGPEAAQTPPARGEGRVVGHYDKEVLGHAVRTLGKVFYERDILAYLYAHQVVEFFLVAVLQKGYIGADIKVAALDEKLHRKLEAVEEVLELPDNGLLLILRLKGQVDR